MRAFVFHLNQFIYPDEGVDKELELSRFYATLHGYKLAGKRFTTDRGTEVYSIDGTEIYEGDIVEIRYDLTRLEILSGMKAVLRGTIVFEDGCYTAVNNEERWMEYLTNEPQLGCKFFVKIIGHKHDKTQKI